MRVTRIHLPMLATIPHHIRSTVRPTAGGMLARLGLIKTMRLLTLQPRQPVVASIKD